MFSMTLRITKFCPFKEISLLLPNNEKKYFEN